jgi:hypothetical protein
MTSATDEQPHIGNYRLQKTIGKGNFAKVKLARHVLTGREVSVLIFALTPPEFCGKFPYGINGGCNLVGTDMNGAYTSISASCVSCVF